MKDTIVLIVLIVAIAVCIVSYFIYSAICQGALDSGEIHIESEKGSTTIKMDGKANENKKNDSSQADRQEESFDQ